MDDDARVLARLDRIGALDRSGAPAPAVLAELRGLLRDAAASTERTTTSDAEEVIGRARTAQRET